MSEPTRPGGGPEDLPAEEITRTHGAFPDVGPAETEIPETIGPYRIVGKLGEGGMGVVFEAEQQHPKRRVALKVIRGGKFVDDNVIRMFRREVDTLARLRHQNIGAIYESGHTPDGRQFFAMELVRGRSLRDYIVSRPAELSGDELRFRLALFRKIADAVHYAHQQGVIHRDLKPSNIVVTDEVSSEDYSQSGSGVRVGPRLPEVKILDFGLARITEGDLANVTQITEIGMIKGTLAYMSPEQARGVPEQIDVRTDVYALGVILYEMLAGTRPIDVQQDTLVEMVRKICEEPPRPLRQSLSGTSRVDADVETIVGKALEKSRDRRYSSAAALSEDIERYLTSQPIFARRPSTLYQLRKFAGRNRVLVGGVAATLVVLACGTAVSTVFGLRAQAQRRVAEANLDRALEAESRASREAQTAQAVSDFMVDLFETSDPVRARGASITAREILDRGVTRIDRELGDQPRVRANLLVAMGRVYLLLGQYKEAAALLEQAVELQESAAERDAPALATALNQYATVLLWLGEYDEAQALARQALAIRESELGTEHPAVAEVLNTLGNSLQNGGELEAARAVHQRAVEIRETTLGPTHEELAASLHNLAIVHYFLGQNDDAERLYLRSAEIEEAVGGPDNYQLASSLHTLAMLYQDQGRFEEAIPLSRRALAIREKVLGPEHPHVAYSLTALGQQLCETGKAAQAEPMLRRAVAIGTEVWDPTYNEVRWMKRGLALSLIEQGKFDAAARLLTRLLEDSEREVGEESLPPTLSLMARLRARQGRDADAEALYRRALAIGERVEGDDSPYLTEALAGLANLQRDRRQYDQAEALYRRALGIMDAHEIQQSHERQTLVADYAALLALTGREAQAGSLR